MMNLRTWLRRQLTAAEASLESIRALIIGGCILLAIKLSIIVILLVYTFVQVTTDMSPDYIILSILLVFSLLVLGWVKALSNNDKATVPTSIQISYGETTVEVSAAADPRVRYLCIPQALALKLHLPIVAERSFVAEGQCQVSASYVGPIKVEALGQVSYMCALATGEEVILGELPLLDMGLVIRPKRKETASKYILAVAKKLPVINFKA